LFLLSVRRARVTFTTASYAGSPGDVEALVRGRGCGSSRAGAMPQRRYSFMPLWLARNPSRS
jgi:hypothetical protein